MKKIKLENQNAMAPDEYFDLLLSSNHLVNKVYDMGPSDNDFIIHIKKKLNNKFLVTAKMASINLAFDLQETAKSPFVALDKVLKKAMARVQKWSVMRGK